jgi:predicted N-formylglutamate amidohydrolase
MPGARSPVRSIELVITCEHGGHRIPAPYRRYFRGAGKLLASHRGYDRGALHMARDFARALGAALLHTTVSRLLVELNRSAGHRQGFSSRVPSELHAELLRRYYEPYRQRLERRVAAAVRRGKRVVHLSCHSFTPRLAGVQRVADVGLLYDPRRSGERALCRAWQKLLARDGKLLTRRNYPYRGWSDGLTTDLRKRFSARDYTGVELEVNQKFPRAGGARWRRVRDTLIATFAAALDQSLKA